METINQRYTVFHKANPHLGDFILLSMSVRGMKYGKQKIYDAFNKYVPKGDYAHEERDILMNKLVEITSVDSPLPKPTLNIATGKWEN